MQETGPVHRYRTVEAYDDQRDGVGSLSHPGDPERTAEWYERIPEELKNFPQIKAVQLWSSTGDRHPVCDFRFDVNPVVIKGVKKFAASPLMNIEH